jgi:hypothetical protein
MNQLLRKLASWAAPIALLALVAACSPTKPTQDTSQATSTPAPTSDNSQSEQTPLKPSPPPLPKTTHKIGEAISLKDKNLNVQFTVNGVREHQGKGVIKPDHGKKWMVVSTTIANQGHKTETISVVSFELVDNKNNPYDVALLAAALEDVKSPTGEIKPGDERRGEVAFEVPEDAKELKLLFLPNRSACENPASKSKISETVNCELVAVNLK